MSWLRAASVLWLVPGNNELCTIDAPATDTWFVSLRGFAAYSAAALTVTVGTP